MKKTLILIVASVVVGAGFVYALNNTRTQDNVRPEAQIITENTPVPLLPSTSPTPLAGQETEFTDDTTDESILIKTDRKIYEGFSSSQVRVTIENTRAVAENITLQFLFPREGLSLKEVSQVVGATTKSMKVNRPTGRALQVQKPIPKNLVEAGNIVFPILPHEKLVFKMKLSYYPGTQGEFWFQALGDKGGYGLLDPWFNSNWTYRKRIIINEEKVTGSSDLSNFPVLVSLLDLDLRASASGGNVQKVNAVDVRFTDSTGGPASLSYELERYTASTGELIAWVKVPTLGATSDTTIYMYYGNAAAVNDRTPTAVWDSNYILVSHLPNGTTLSGSDSTTNGNNGTINSATAIAGKIEGAANFDGTNDDVDYGSAASLDNLFQAGSQTGTISAWLKRGATDIADFLVGKGQQDNDLGWQFFIRGPGGSNRLAFSPEWTTRPEWDSTNVINDTTSYHHIVVTYNGSSTTNDAALYIDGVAETVVEITAPAGSAVADGVHNLRIGDGDAPSSLDYTGVIDEVRVSNSIRSADWIKTEYNNQASPKDFYVVGGQEVARRTDPSAKVKGGVNLRGDVKLR